jgi:tartrate-resistant acid phosphatase type 5
MSSILCLGNFGDGNDGQLKVKDLMLYLYKKYNYRFILGLGNNILPNGVISNTDIEFKKKFEEPYKELLEKVKFYNILGEKDSVSNKSIKGEINYSKINKKWILPHNFYCFKQYINKVPVEFIILDSNKIKNKTQEVWSINTILESKSRWNIVISHHPWYNNGTNNECSDELNNLFNKLNSTKKVDLIISGNKYSQQHIYVPNKPNMIISGVGSNFKDSINNNPIIKIYDQLKFTSKEMGCCVIEFTKNKLNVSFYNIKKEKLHNFSIIKY